VKALDELLADQDRARASLLKQRMQELSQGAFDESHQGDESFRQFLERFPSLVKLQQRGTTLLVIRPEEEVDPAQLHLRYRTYLKKKGLRVVPSTIRLKILKDVCDLLDQNETMQWRSMVEELWTRYQHEDGDISKSYINDVLRLARRSGVINVQNGTSLAQARVPIRLEGDRIYQEAVFHCDAAYLKEIQQFEEPLNLDEASVALYESANQVRYLRIVIEHYLEDQPG
jgi:hypothetical protein